jgi:PKD repeat protein
MVTVYPAVDPAFTADKIIVCSGGSITFTTAPGASKYFWDYGDATSGYAPTEVTTHLYTNFTTAPVVLTVKLTTTSFYNCTDEETMTVTVMPMPQPQFGVDKPTQIFDPDGNTVAFTDQTNAGTWIYGWDFDDGGTSTAQNPTHTYTALGTYNVTLKVNNANCSDSITHKVSVLPKAPVADFDTIPSGCEPWPVSLSNTSQWTEMPGTKYRWDFGDGSYSTAENPVYTYFDWGDYNVELTVTGPGGVSV